MMAALDFERYEVLSFDCYGTLIDWETGILSALRPVLEARAVRTIQTKEKGVQSYPCTPPIRPLAFSPTFVGDESLEVLSCSYH
jgi:hypothetical protein